MMNKSQYTSRLLDNAVANVSKLPGIGRKTALRLVLHLLKEDKEDVEALTESLRAVRNDVRYCRSCHNICDSDTCEICADNSRNHRQLCVVESIKDVLAIEATRQYAGVYHVLGGVVSPMEGIGPDELNIESLEAKVSSGNVDEVILALSTTMEGDTTNFYIYKRIAKYGVMVTTIARGVAVGDELEYADEVTLGRSLTHRVPFDRILL